jgi:hypothetical protein
LVWSFTAAEAKNVNVYAVDHRLYDPPMRDVTYTHTALTADAADRIGRRQGAGMWAVSLALIIIMAGAFVVGKALISLIDDGTAKPATITAQAAKPTAIGKRSRRHKLADQSRDRPAGEKFPCPTILCDFVVGTTAGREISDRTS